MTALDTSEKLSIRLGVLLGYVGELRPYMGLSKEELGAERDRILKIERLFELAAECVLDISRMVVADQRLKIPEDNKGYILALGGAGVLDAEFFRKFAAMAGFRNVLVHMYLEIDYGDVADNLKRLNDLTRFAEQVARFYELKIKE